MKNSFWIIVGVLIVLLFGMVIYHFTEIEKVYQEIQIEKQEYIEKIDSINKINNMYQTQTDSITNLIDSYKGQLDSIIAHKTMLEEKLNSFHISTSIDENIALLRQNLCEN